MGFFLNLLKTRIGTHGPDFVPMLALRELSCRFTAEYTPYDGALIFRDIASRAVRREIVQAVEDVCRERGKELELYLDQAHTDA